MTRNPKGDALLHLFHEWARGVAIIAGVGAFPPHYPPAPRTVRKCGRCPTWCIGASKVDAECRLAAHRRRCHG